MPYTQFTIEERDMLQVLKGADVPLWAIARFIAKDISSIYRELSRNSVSGLYLSHKVQNATEKRRQIGKFPMKPSISMYTPVFLRNQNCVTISVKAKRNGVNDYLVRINEVLFQTEPL